MQTTMGNSTHPTLSQEDSRASLSNIFEPTPSLNTSTNAHSMAVENTQEATQTDDDLEAQQSSFRQTLEINGQNLPGIEERVDERITDRIANHYALLLMPKPPEADKHFEYPTTVIAPEGAYQWNSEIEQWTCRLSAENFNATYQELSFLLQRAAEITNAEGESAYHLLTFKQLNDFDQAIRFQYGDTIIGYTICEEIYLRTLNFLVWLFCRRYSEYDYPPLPDAYSKRVLTFIQRPLVLDIFASIRVAAQFNILFSYLTYTYFLYTPESQDDDYQFFNNNNLWLLLAQCGVIVVSLLLLRSSCMDKSRVLSGMIRLRWIEQSIIGMILNLINYGPFLASATVLEGSLLPLIILGGLIGYSKNVGEVINIAQWTTFQFLLRSFFLSLTMGSFCELGFDEPLNYMLFLYDDDFNPAAHAEFFQDDGFIRYSAFAIMLLVSFFRFPSASLTTQDWGRYASNGMNGIGIALFDNYALTLLIGSFIVTFNGSDYFSPQKPAAPILLCTLTALSFIAVFLVTFPTTPDLSKYSLEKTPINPTWITKTLRFFNSIPGRCLLDTPTEATATHAVSKDGIEIQTSILSKASRSISVSQFYPRTQSRDIQPPISNPMSRLNDFFSEETKLPALERQYAI